MSQVALKDEAVEARRKQSEEELRHLEQFHLFLVAASPIIGALGLWFTKTYLMTSNLITNFNIFIFALAAGIRPVMHITSDQKNRAILLQQEVHYPNTEIDYLRNKLILLERELLILRTAYATKKDLVTVKDTLENPLHQINKAVRRFEKKENIFHSYSEEKFAEMENKIRDFEEYVSRVNEQSSPFTASRAQSQAAGNMFNDAGAWATHASTGLMGSFSTIAAKLILLPVYITSGALHVIKYYVVPKLFVTSTNKPMLKPNYM